MPTFDFALFVDGLDASDPEQIDKLFAGGCDDAIPSAQDGVTTVAFARDADRPEDALWSAVRDIESAVNGARVKRLDADLVNLTEIAHRAGVKRQAARLWAEGKRRKSFPQPDTWVGVMRLWRWSDVYGWLTQVGSPVDEDFVPVDAHTARCFDVALLMRPAPAEEGWHRVPTPPASPARPLVAGSQRVAAYRTVA